MGTLASIAIPAYNEYRRSAKKNAYRADLSSMHKGWLAFGVELDSFCQRETTPEQATIGTIGMRSLLSGKLYGPTPNDASIESVGMRSLVSSKLYGNNSVATDANCDVGGTPTPANLRPSMCNPSSSDCTSCSAGAFSAYVPAGSGPGKTNFIGFGAEACPNAGTGIPQVIILENGRAASSEITGEGDCDLDVTRYELGVVGHVSGANYFIQSITHQGVLSTQSEATDANVTPQCT